jgi:hypothetical protein
MAFTFHPNKIVFNDSTEITTAPGGNRYMAQATRTTKKTFSGVTSWDDSFLSVDITTTTSQTILYTCSFSILFEENTIKPEIRFLRGSTVVHTPDWVMAWQHGSNRATGAHQFMWAEENVAAGSYNCALGLRNNDGGSYFHTCHYNNGVSNDVFTVYYY